MGTAITYEELTILNSLLDNIPIGQGFSVMELHCEYVLKPKCLKSDGSIDLTKYDSAKNDFVNRGVYKHITDYLVEQYFAAKVKYSELLLNDSGEKLWAYGSLEKYLSSFNSSTKEEIVSRVPLLIEKASLYGEFTVAATMPNVQVLNIKIFNPNDEEERQKIKEALDPKERLKLLHKQSFKDEEVMQYLVNEGFAINRHDIKVEGKLYRQLTGSGRLLKEKGSIEKYRRAIQDEAQQKKSDKEYLEGLTTRQFQLTEQQALYTQRSYLVNFCIAVATAVAGIYYIFSLFDYYQKHCLNWQFAAYFLTGLGLGLLIWLVRSQLKKISSKTENR